MDTPTAKASSSLRFCRRPCPCGGAGSKSAMYTKRPAAKARREDSARSVAAWSLADAVEAAARARILHPSRRPEKRP